MTTPKIISEIANAGHKAAVARRNGDEYTARFHEKWAFKAISEATNIKVAARAFRNAYRKENNDVRQ